MKSLADLSKFQLILMGVFSVFILVGVIIFAMGGIGGGRGVEVSSATVWGTMRASDFRQVLESSGLEDDETLSISYVQKSESSFDRELLEALASQEGPDIIIIPDNKILSEQNRITTVPFSENFSERDFRDTFLPVSEIYITPQGFLGLPFMVDPLVMYWNRDIFINEAVLEPPTMWSQLHSLATLFSERVGSSGLSQSAVALGEFRNVANATEILSALIMQAGNPISQRSGAKVESVLNQKTESQPVVPAVSAMNFFTEFSNPLKASYSWSRSLPSSRDYFISGDLAIYFGFASELPFIQASNPNLNFDIALIPQTSDDSRTTYGKTQALSLVKGSRNPTAAFRIMRTLTSRSAIEALGEITGLPPVRLDLAGNPPSTRFDPVFYSAAIRSKSWVSPGKEVTDMIFLDMVESITSGRENVSSALNRAHSELNLEFSSLN